MCNHMQSLVVYRLVHAPVTRESGVRLPAREYFCFEAGHGISHRVSDPYTRFCTLMIVVSMSIV